MRKIITFILAALVLASCSKDKEVIDNPVPKQIKKLSYLNGSQYEYSFNPDGKPKQVIQTTASNVYVTNYNYTPGKISYTILRNGKLNESGEFTLQNGKPVSLDYTYYDNSENPIENNTDGYEYNAKGLLSKMQLSSGAYYIFAYDEKGNLVESGLYNNNQMASRVYYSYYEQENKYPWVTGETHSGLGFFFPPRATQLLKTVETRDPQTDELTQKYDITHSMDASGFVQQSVYDQSFPAINQDDYTITFEFE